MIQLLVDNPLLLLFAVAAMGYLLGQIRIGGFSLGVAAVLFTGLAAGSLHPDLKLPEIVYLAVSPYGGHEEALRQSRLAGKTEISSAASR